MIPPMSASSKPKTFCQPVVTTGESDPIEKLPAATHTGGSVVDLENICFMGSNVVSGAAKAVVFATGNDTYLGTIAKSIAGTVQPRPSTKVSAR